MKSDLDKIPLKMAKYIVGLSKVIHWSDENTPNNELIKRLQLCCYQQERRPLVFVMSPWVSAGILSHGFRGTLERCLCIPTTVMTTVLDERFPMDVTEPGYHSLVERACGSSTCLTTLRTLRPSPIHLPNLLTLRATGDRLQAVSRGLGVTAGREVTMTQLQVPLHCPATASQRAAALHCLSNLVRVFRRSHGLWSGQGVGEWIISTTTGSEITVRAAGMLPSCLRFDGRIRAQVSISGQLLSLTSGGSNKPAHAAAPSASDQTKSYFPCKTSVISRQPSRAQKLWKKSPKHKHCHNANKLCMVPEMLLVYTLCRFVYAIYPLKDFSPWIEEVIEKRIELTWQLFLLVQEALAKATKTRALQRALRRLSEPNQNHGPLELRLGDLLYSNFEKDFPSQRPLVPEAFLGDHQLCLEVSVMVSRVLLQHWTPRITFSPDCEVQDISPRLRRHSGSLTRHWSSMDNLSEFVDEGDEEQCSVEADGKQEKKGLQVFFAEFGIH